MELERYSVGIGDRFGHEAKAQLRALQAARDKGIAVVPVWNKSNREHIIIGTKPSDARRRADDAVRASGWPDHYYVDADHIGLATVEAFLEPCDFFTIDVADDIGWLAEPEAVRAFVAEMSRSEGRLAVPGLEAGVDVSEHLLTEFAAKYLFAVEEAGRVYRHIENRKGRGNFITEVSFDEAGSPQTPTDLLFLLAAVAREGIPAQTIAPKFSGAFLKGIDYVGDIHRFSKEFAEDLAVVDFAKRTFGLPANLKLSIHSGSDKFSLYPLMHRAMTESGAGIHLKTAGTTWLEEVIGLAASGGDGLEFASDLYAAALGRFDELAKPYRAVIDIDPALLPSAATARSWSPEEFASALEHNPSSELFNPHFRQLIHISFRIAAEMGRRFTGLLDRYRETIEYHVTNNLLRRHIEPLFLGDDIFRKR